MDKATMNIFCEACQKTIEKVDIKEKKVGESAGCQIMKKYFECPHCGRQYTITVTDREMRLLIQKRQQLQGRIRMAAARRMNAGYIQKLTDAERELGKDLMKRSEALKEQYRKE